MAQSLYISSVCIGSGLSSSAMGVFRACEHMGLRVSYYKPIGEFSDNDDIALQFLRQSSYVTTQTPISFVLAEQFISIKRVDELIEKILYSYEKYAQESDIVIVEGINPDKSGTFVGKLNPIIAQALESHVLLVASPLHFCLDEFFARLEIHLQLYKRQQSQHMIGVLFNKMNAPDQKFDKDFSVQKITQSIKLFQDPFITIAGFIPWAKSFNCPRMVDIQRYLKAKILSPGDIFQRRVQQCVLGISSPKSLSDKLLSNTLVITPAEREDVIVTTALAAVNGVSLAGLLLTSGLEIDKELKILIDKAIESGLPIMAVEQSTQDILEKLYSRPEQSESDDHERLDLVSESLAQNIDHDVLKKLIGKISTSRLTPPAFRYQLIARASKHLKTIVLPEGEEERTVQAAVICHEKNIARCVLLGNEKKIKRIIEQNHLSMPNDLKILDPKSIKDRYIEPMVQIRAHKHLLAEKAAQQLDDPIVLGTMMVAQGDVDGLVAGAVHTTANTIRPALQLIGVEQEYSLMSSVFFMGLPDQVVVYGDCAVNPSPDAQQLASIAIQSARSAKQFGIEPKVAMVSYSTGTSGQGEDVQKVLEATQIAKKMDPDLIIDGPLQYDAAVNIEVAKKKAPDSPVAGQATVFVFPDLNTGNTTYKAVQRSAQVVSIGPMLQGLKAPVNDLSRGALVDDIVYTVALTAIQAQSSKEDG